MGRPLTLFLELPGRLVSQVLFLVRVIGYLTRFTLAGQGVGPEDVHGCALHDGYASVLIHVAAAVVLVEAQVAADASHGPDLVG